MFKQQIVEFEDAVAKEFNAGHIRAPIHLSSGNEEKIIKVFERIKDADWVCCTWRNHVQALLKGVPSDKLMEYIKAGKSMVLNLPEYKFVSSSIVGGIPSIATGLALAAKIKNTQEKVYCWTGDMSAATGAWSEAYRFAKAHNLPIVFVVEDNGLSVTTPTQHVWGSDHWYLPSGEKIEWYEDKHLIYYTYQNDKYPHAGAGIRVQF